MNIRNEKIKVKKEDLIAKIKANKEAHQKEYQEAVVAYKEEAAKQLAAQTQALAGGSLEITLDLVHPVDRSKEYDKLITMFEWEQDVIVQVTQNEFNQYVMDETDFAISAKFLNSTYTSRKLKL